MTAAIETKKETHRKVEASQSQIDRAPVGNLNHRRWTGDCLKEPRVELASPRDRAVVRGCDVSGDPAWEKALAPRPPLPRRKRSKVETFNWHIKPVHFPPVGRVYSDGSLRDATFHELGRSGWAFVIIDGDGNVIAAAYGAPPPWVEGIEGAEAWGLLQGLLHTIPDLCRY